MILNTCKHLKAVITDIDYNASGDDVIITRLNKKYPEGTLCHWVKERTINKNWDLIHWLLFPRHISWCGYNTEHAC